MTRSRSTVHWLCAISIAVLASGCSGSSKASEDRGSIRPLDVAPREGAVSQAISGHVEIEIRGPALTGSFKGDMPLRIVTFVGAEIPTSGWMTALGPNDFVPMQDGASVRPAFDLVGYEGAGTYRIEAPVVDPLTDEDAENGAEAVKKAARSDAFVPVKRGDAITNYNVMVQPCQLLLTDRAHSGRLLCPKLSNGNDEIELSFSWQMDPTKVLDDAGGDPPDRSAGTATSSTANPGKDKPTTAPTAPAASGMPTSPVIEGDVPIELKIVPACVAPGKTAVARVETIANAAVSLAPAFSGGDQGALYDSGRSDGSGRYSWTFQVPAGVQEGDASMLFTISSEDAQHGGGGMVPFKVAKRC